jgi:hypothetical protein
LAVGFLLQRGDEVVIPWDAPDAASSRCSSAWRSWAIRKGIDSGIVFRIPGN